MRPLSIALLLLSGSCAEQPYTSLSGRTMGTYYNIQYSSGENLQQQIDSLLNSFIAAASTYDSTSELSSFNRSGFLQFKSPHLFSMLKLARQLHHKTKGLFEPTLAPLIKAHGFLHTKRQELREDQIDSLLSFVGFDYVTFDDMQMQTIKPGVQLDLSAMGEGYTIDMIAEFLKQKNVENYKVEIGGEVKCKGRNSRGEFWRIGIENPLNLNANTLLTTTQLFDEAISTSGTSRKFHIDQNGIKRSHIIDPGTGTSIESNLLSVTVKDSMAVRADVYSTALMVMSLDSAKAFINRENIDALILYQENGKALSWHSPDF